MILAVDLGTGSLKAGLITHDGRLKARTRVSYPNPPGLGHDEFNPLEWELAFLEALKHLPAASVSCVALSGNGPTLVPCDAQGTPLAPAHLWLHSRSRPLEGCPSYYLPKADLLRHSNPDVWERTRLLLSCPEWLQFRLTGRPLMTVPHEGFRPYVWDASQIRAYGLDAKLFPGIVVMGEPAGTVTESSPAAAYVPAGTPVAAVGSDFMAALLGSGAYTPGTVCDRAGSSEGINYCSNSPSAHPELRDLPHVVDGLWNSAAILSSTGTVFEWYRRLTGQEQRSYSDMLADVEAVPPGAQAPLFFPGPRGGSLWEFGNGSFHKLAPCHGRAEMGRAVMEAIGFAVRRGIEFLEDTGRPVESMRVTGGQARGAVWNQMKADITGKTLLIPEVEDAELIGGAACALTALGRAETPLLAADSLVRIKQRFLPRPGAVSVYNEAYERYAESAWNAGGSGRGSD